MTKEKLNRAARHPQQNKIFFSQKILKTQKKMDLHLLGGRIVQVSKPNYLQIKNSINIIKIILTPLKNFEEFKDVYEKTWLPVMMQVNRCINEIKNGGFNIKSVHWNLYVLYESDEIGPHQIFLTKLLQTCSTTWQRDPIIIAQEYILHLYNGEKVGGYIVNTDKKKDGLPIYPNVLYLNHLNTQIKPQYSCIFKTLYYDASDIDGFL